MQIDITPEVVLNQLGFSHTPHALKQMERIINNTNGFEKFGKHVFALNEQLQHMHALIAPSNSNDYLKIKLDENAVAREIIDEFHEHIQHWSEKYKVAIEKVQGKETYYITGSQG